MGYGVGIDVGTTYSAAAVFRDGQVRSITLGQQGDATPTTVFLKDDGEFIVGDVARRRLIEDPSGGAREFKRRMGDTTPLVVGGSPYSADRLMGVVIRHILQKVTEAEGGPPAHVVVTHPSNWQTFKIDLLRQAATAVAQPATVSLVEEPVAAAIQYAHAERIEVGELVGVYDLGGGTFDAAVLQRTEEGFRRLGEPAGIERLGGIDFDAALVAHVQRSLGERFDVLDRDDRAVRVGLEQLRDECIEAKEALSADTSATINVSLPGLHDSVRITRGEFEKLIRPVLAETMESLRTAIRQAGTTADDLATVLLIGGSSRIPLVSDIVSAELGRPVAVDSHPKLSVAMGAAVASGQYLEGGGDGGGPAPLGPAGGDDDEDDRHGTGDGSGIDRSKVLRLVGIAAVAVATVLALGWYALGRDGSSGGGEEPEEQLSVEIESVVIENGHYRVDFRTTGFTPEFGRDPELRHVHFFFDTTEPANAGENGSPPGEWDLTQKDTSFVTKFTPAERGDAEQMCAIVATNAHDVLDPESGDCVPLPEIDATPTEPTDPTTEPTEPTDPTTSPTPTDPTPTPTPTPPPPTPTS